MRFEIARLHSTLNTTMIYVTHDQVEAMTLADRIVVLKDGLVMQMGTPVELYESPGNLFVAEFIGSPKMNVMPCQCDSAGVRLTGHAGIPCELPADFAARVAKLGIRPEHISLCETNEAHCHGVVEFAEYLGSDTFLYVKCDNLGTLTVRTQGAVGGLKGRSVGLQFAPANVHLFDREDYTITF